MSGTVFARSALWAAGDFQAQGGDCCGRPSFVSIRTASIHAAAEGREFHGRLRLIDVLDPNRRPPKGPWRQSVRIGGRSAGPPRETAPTPLSGPQNQIGAECVAFDVSAHRQKMDIRLDREGFEASLVQVTRSRGTAVSVPALRTRQREPFCETRQFAVLLRPNDHVPVVSHQAVTQESCPRRFQRLPQNPRNPKKFFVQNRQVLSLMPSSRLPTNWNNYVAMCQFHIEIRRPDGCKQSDGLRHHRSGPRLCQPHPTTPAR